MKTGYKITGSIWSTSKYFYVYNFPSLNELFLAGFLDKNKKTSVYNECVGVWKIKN